MESARDQGAYMDKMSRLRQIFHARYHINHVYGNNRAEVPRTKRLAGVTRIRTISD
jgi:hypothetical protein